MILLSQLQEMLMFWISICWMRLKSGCVVCNIGHFDNEIDVKYLKTFEWYEVKPGVHKVIKPKKLFNTFG